jgi:hypothetical protein
MRGLEEVGSVKSPTIGDPSLPSIPSIPLKFDP